MDLRHLRYYQAVAEELSFSKAARRLHIAQPALSRAVKELEEALGVELLTRTRRSVMMTQAGSVLLHETALLLQRFNETMLRVRRTAAGEEGELRLGYIGPPTQAFLGRIVKEFRKRYPRVAVVLEERTPERVWEMVAKGRLAVGLTRPVLPHHALGLNTIVLRQERLHAALPAGHPLAKNRSLRWKQLANQPLIILSRREGISLHDAVLAACHQAGFAPSMAHTPSLITTVLSYVEAEAGIGVVSESICSLGEGMPLVFRPLTPAQTVELVMVWPEKNDTPPAAAFRRLVCEWKRAGLLWERLPGVSVRNLENA
ncbi:MAG: LysR family transcriptional regulator [Verrucomicrobiales bacterium]|nr:LysR family transcriptional regulator [Verrucomicrobiales bacterium]